MTAMGLASHGTQDMYPTFLERHWNIGVHTRTVMTSISMVGAIIGGVLVGLFSDRIGRRRAIAFALFGAILAVPLWAFAPSVPLLVVGAFLLQLFVQGAWGVIPAHITELSPDAVRGLLPGFAYQCGILLAGTITTVEAALAERIRRTDVVRVGDGHRRRALLRARGLRGALRQRRKRRRIRLQIVAELETAWLRRGSSRTGGDLLGCAAPKDGTARAHLPEAAATTPARNRDGDPPPSREAHPSGSPGIGRR
jgi:hypothetical protein